MLMVVARKLRLLLRVLEPGLCTRRAATGWLSDGVKTEGTVKSSTKRWVRHVMWPVNFGAHYSSTNNNSNQMQQATEKAHL